MITAEKLKLLSTLEKHNLVAVLAQSGYTGCSFESAEFLGITNGGQFCYQVKYFDDGGGPNQTLETGKVFVTYHANQDQLTADY
jgi:hypothetical protein